MESIILPLIQIIKSEKISRNQVLLSAREKYPNAGFEYYKSIENSIIQLHTSNIIRLRNRIKELTNAN